MDETTTLCVTVQNGEHLLSGPDWLKVSDSKTLIDVLVEVSGTQALGHQVQVVVSKEPSFTEAALVQVLNPVSMLRISGSVYVKFLLKSSVLPVEHKYMDNKCKAERDTDISPLHFLQRPATISNPEEQNVFSTINDTFDKPFESNYLNKLFNESKLSPSTIRSIKEELAKKHQIKNTDSLTTWQQQSEIAINQGTDKQQTKVITSPEKELVRWGHTETESVSATQEHSGTKTQAAAEDKLQESDNIKEMTKKEHLTSTAMEAEVLKTVMKQEGSEGKDTKTLAEKINPLKASRSHASKIKKVITPGTAGPKADKKDSIKTGMPILCHKTSRPVISKITSTAKCKNVSTKADWNTAVKSKIDCRRTITGVSAVKATAMSKSGATSKRVNSLTRSSKHGKDEEGAARSNGTANASAEKDRPVRKPVRKTLLSVTRTHKATNDVQRAGGKLDISKTITRNSSGKVKADKSDATSTQDLHVSILNSVDHDHSKQQSKTLTVKAGTETIDNVRQSSVQGDGIRDELSTSKNEDSGYDVSLGSFDGVDGNQTTPLATENSIDRENNCAEKEESGAESKKHHSSSIQDSFFVSEVNLNVEGASDANSVSNVKGIDDNFGSKDLLHDRQISDRNDFENTDNVDGVFGSIIDQFTEEETVVDEMNGIMEAVKDKIVAEGNSAICEYNAPTAGDSTPFNEDSEITKKDLVTSITSDNQHGMDRKVRENLQEEYLKPTIADKVIFPKKDAVVSTRTPFFCSLLDDPITSKIRTSYDSLDYMEYSEMTRKGKRTENGIKRSESLNGNILSPSHKKSGFFHHLKELTVDSDGSTFLSIATKVDHRSADDIQVASDKQLSLNSNRSQYDIESAQSSSKCHGDKDYLTSSSNMLNVTHDRDMDHDFSLFSNKELEVNHDTKSEVPASLAEIGRESAISRTFTLEEENNDDATAGPDKAKSCPRASEVVDNRAYPGNIATNDNREPESSKCHGTSGILCSDATTTTKNEEVHPELDHDKDIECHIRRQWNFQFGIMDQLLLTSIVDLSRDLNAFAERISHKLNRTKSLSHIEETRGSITGRTSIVDRESEELFHNLKKLERELRGIEEAFDRQAS